MEIKIFGKKACFYCDKAKILAKSIKQSKIIYIDIEEHNISKKDLTDLVKKEVKTFPQILINNVYIGGCSELEKYLIQSSK